MSTPVIAFFNNKGGVGKTTLVYHLSWMLSEMGVRVLAADLDPQANLTASFISDERAEQLIEAKNTVYGSLEPLLAQTGDIKEPYTENIHDALSLLPGDLSLTGFEDELSDNWYKCLDSRQEGPFRVVTAFWRMVQKAAEKERAEVILIDLGPNLGAINRSALISSDYVVFPLSPDLYSLRGLQNLGPALAEWRGGWKKRLEESRNIPFPMPKGIIEPLGYIVQRHSVRLDRPVKAFERWIEKIPLDYQRVILSVDKPKKLNVNNDKNCLALLKDYRSLMPLAQEAFKPVFSLQPADGAIGAHMRNVHSAREDFNALATKVLARARVSPKA